MKKECRREKDPLGEKDVPINAYYGIQTLRAIENFPISGTPPQKKFIIAFAMVKKAAAIANMATGSLNKNIGKAIVRASDEIIQGKLHKEFVVDVYQAGAGTSHNMNANEVIANRAIELLGGKKGDYRLIHPNDHVNMAQSTNDVFPTAMRLAAVESSNALLKTLHALTIAFAGKARLFDRIIKSARTHLQDAVPIRMGQEFLSYAECMGKCGKRIEKAREGLKTLGIGGTAAGTGLNSHPGYRSLMVKKLSEITGIMDLRPAPSMPEAINSMADFVEFSG